MDIRNRKALRAAAAARAAHPGGKRTALIYVAIACGTSLLLTLLDLFFSHQISNTGGLGSMGLRSALATAQTILPLAQSLVMLCLGLGYQKAMVDLYRRHTTEPRTLTEGFRRCGPLFRLTILQALICFGIVAAAFYISFYVFLLLPFSDRFMELIEPVLANMNVMNSVITMDEATALAAGEAMLPMLWIFVILFLLLYLPVYYRYRMAQFCLCEDPVPGALSALRQSRSMMRKHCLSLFLVDLSLWWYYLLQMLVTGVSITGVILAIFGVSLPWFVNLLVFPLLSLALQFCLYYFCLNRVTLTYAAAYDALRPKPQTSSGVPLGNIFDLYRQSNEYQERHES